ncbi:MAG: MFS transporter, partial [Candidatus Hydrogenedentes bacterium]|nr:MFS transporter [Candidatus Hydrogenedentota bacterium]
MLKPHHRQYAAVFLFDLSMVAGLTVSPFYIFHFLGGGALMSGVVTGLQWGLYAASCLLSARHVSRARNGLSWAVAGAAGFAVLFPLAPLVKNPYFFGVLTTTAMASTGLFWPAMQAWIGAEPDRRLRLRRMSHYNLSWTVGLTIAPILAGPLYNADYRLPFLLVFATAAGAMALVMSLPHESKHFQAPTEEMIAAHAAHDRESEAHLPTAWGALLIGCALIAAMCAVFSLRMEELVKESRLSLLWRPTDAPLAGTAVTYFAWLALIMYATRAGTSLVMGVTHLWQHKFWLLALTQVAAGGACWVLAQTSSLAVMIVCALAIGVAAGVSF